MWSIACRTDFAPGRRSRSHWRIWVGPQSRERELGGDEEAVEGHERQRDEEIEAGHVVRVVRVEGRSWVVRVRDSARPPVAAAGGVARALRGSPPSRWSPSCVGAWAATRRLRGAGRPRPPAGTTASAAEPPPELPRGGRSDLPGAPGRRLLRRAAVPRSSARWASARPDGAARRLLRAAAALRAQDAPGAAGAGADRGGRPGRRRRRTASYRFRQTDSIIRRYLARRAGSRRCCCSTSSPAARTSSPRPSACASGSRSPTSASRWTPSGA